MNIGKLAKNSGVSAKTIRYYESIGLLPPASRSANGYRVFEDSDLQTLRFIQRARGLGFSVKDVLHLLSLWRDPGRSSSEVKALARRHMEHIDTRIDDLQTMRRVLDDLAHRCHGDSHPECPILDTLAGANANVDTGSEEKS